MTHDIQRAQPHATPNTWENALLRSRWLPHQRDRVCGFCGRCQIFYREVTRSAEPTAAASASLLLLCLPVGKRTAGQGVGQGADFIAIDLCETVAVRRGAADPYHVGAYFFGDA